MFRRINSMPGLALAAVAIMIPFTALLSHHLDGLALIALPLALIAARMERGARMQRG
jgi:hypothetical protein